MAEVQAAESDLLHTKWGPLPVWVWALAGLAAAWLYAKHKAGTQQASQQTQQNASEPQDVAPEFLIQEGNTSTTVNNAPSAPVPVSPGKPPVTSPPGKGPHPPVKSPGKPPRPVTGGKQPKVYRVQSGDTLTSIANRNHVKGGWQALWNYNLSSPLRSAEAKAEMRSRGPNDLVHDEEILIPPQ